MVDLSDLVELVRFAREVRAEQLADRAFIAAAQTDASLMRQLICMELRYNVAVIDTLSPDADQWADACVEVARILETGIIAGTMAPGAANAELRAMIEPIVLNLDDDEVLGFDGLVTVGNVLPLLLVRTQVVKALASMRDRRDGMRAVRLHKRLMNLRKDFDNVRRAIETASPPRP